jgi:splicing factor U2AF subunit
MRIVKQTKVYSVVEVKQEKATEDSAQINAQSNALPCQPPPSSSPSAEECPHRLYIGGLPLDVSEEEVLPLLTKFGPIKRFHLVCKPDTDFSVGYGYCNYERPEGAKQAVKRLSSCQKDLPGSKLFAFHVKPQTTQQPQASTGKNAQCGRDDPTRQSTAASIDRATFFGSAPTRVLKLSNMVTHHDLDRDALFREVCEDVCMECRQFGQVRKMVILRAKDGYSLACEGHIYVEFAESLQATHAAYALHGRKYANRNVVVQYVG